MTQGISAAWQAGLSAALLAVGGCGLKGPLQLPPRSTNVVIRGPETPAEPAAQPGGTAPAPEPAGAPALPEEERLPPPPLPEGNAGAFHGG